MLKSYDAVCLHLENESNIQEYFYTLVTELKEYTVFEIRPIKTIRIDKGISSSKIIEHVDEIKSVIRKYSKRRNDTFREFLDYLSIDQENELFRNIALKIRELNSRQRGSFGEWSFWQHGGDIEFENAKTNEHLNVSMCDKEAISPSSLMKYISSFGEDSNLYQLLDNDIKSIQKALDILVIQGFLIDVPNEIGMKILKLKQELPGDIKL